MTTVGKPQGLPRSIRLIKSAEFGAVLSSPRDRSIRSYSDFFAISAMITQSPGLVRFGFTVGKHNAHLSVERAMIKRLLRESARVHRLTLLEALSGTQKGLDINFRLKCKLPACGPQGLTKQARKILLREDIERLMQTFIAKVSRKSGSMR